VCLCLSLPGRLEGIEVTQAGGQLVRGGFDKRIRITFVRQPGSFYKDVEGFLVEFLSYAEERYSASIEGKVWYSLAF